MYYAKTIWDMHYFERLRPEEIVERMNNPLINLQFVNTVIANNRVLRDIYWDPKNRNPYGAQIRGEISRRKKAGLHRRPNRIDAKYGEKKDLW